MTHKDKKRSEKTYSLRATARAAEMTLSSVQEARDAGRLTVGADGKVADLAVALAELASNGQATAPSSLANRIEGNAPLASTPEGETRAEALRRLAITKADQAALELQRAKGNLCLVSAVLREWITANVTVRDRLLGIHVRVREHCGHTAGEIVDRCVREALEELADSAGDEIVKTGVREARAC